jgi:hypothetical protein
MDPKYALQLWNPYFSLLTVGQAIAYFLPNQVYVLLIKMTKCSGGSLRV